MKKFYEKSVKTKKSNNPSITCGNKKDQLIQGRKKNR